MALVGQAGPGGLPPDGAALGGRALGSLLLGLAAQGLGRCRTVAFTPQGLGDRP
jgi:hypothetical protein